MVQRNKTAKKVRFSKKLHKSSKDLKKTYRRKKNTKQHIPTAIRYPRS